MIRFTTAGQAVLSFLLIPIHVLNDSYAEDYDNGQDFHNYDDCYRHVEGRC
jgi:hypothetical protein